MLPAVFNDYFMLILKGFFIFASGLYLIFAIIVLRQVVLMSKNVKDIHNPLLFGLSVIHLLGSIVLILFCLTLL